MYKKRILKHVHQAFYQAGPAQIVKLFSVKATKYDSRRSKQLTLDRPKKEIGRLTLQHRGTMIWNSIPSSVKDYDNVTLFKNRLKQLSKFINNFTFEKERSLITNNHITFIVIDTNTHLPILVPFFKFFITRTLYIFGLLYIFFFY